ncbi:MAG: hypothetical protein WKF95_13245 [Rubrobacter sp.]
MLGRYAKAGVLVLAFVVLAVEAYLLYEYYDRYYDRSTAASSVAAPEEATRRYASGSDGSADPSMFEDTGPGTARGTGDANPADETTFFHTATDENSRGDYTYLSDPSIDGDPNAVVLAEPSLGRGGDGGLAYGHNVGVWFEPGAKKWAVFNQDRVAVRPGAAFEVVVPRRSDRFVQRAELPNTFGNSTYLDNPLTNGEPDAVVSVTQNWNPGGGGGVYNDHPVGVVYDEDVEKWAVYNEDDAPMPNGAAFNVAVSGDAEPAR